MLGNKMFGLHTPKWSVGSGRFARKKIVCYFGVMLPAGDHHDAGRKKKTCGADFRCPEKASILVHNYAELGKP